MLLFIILIINLPDSAYNTQKDIYCTEVVYQFEKTADREKNSGWICERSAITIEGIDEHGQQLVSSNFYDFVCTAYLGIECTQQYLWRSDVSSDADTLHICYRKNLDYQETYRFVISLLRQPIATLDQFSRTVENLNGTQQIIDVVDDFMFNRSHPHRRSEVLRYYRTILHVEQNSISCLMGEFYQLMWHTLEFPFRIDGRLKTPFSFWSKLTKTDRPIYDVLSFEIVVETIDQCYQVFNVLTSRYPVHAIKDYIGDPKSSGYQSIHLILIGPQPKQTMEVQISTEDMYNDQHFKKTAHSLYKNSIYGDRTY